jgi:cyanophycin synthetase
MASDFRDALPMSKRRVGIPLVTTRHVEPVPVRPFRAASFADWRARLDRHRIDPVIAIAGTRGKTSTVRVLESILTAGGYRFASWTDKGVEIEGEHQRGELGPWSRALTRIKAGGLDVALQEIDWATVPVVGTSSGLYPVVAVANLCANSEACLVTPDMLLARRALSRLRSSVAPFGRLIVNADDFAVADDNTGSTERFLVGISPDTPILRRHLSAGGDACWIEDGIIMAREDGVRSPLAPLDRLKWTRNGTIAFAVQNALMAAAVGRVCGLDARTIGAGLETHEVQPERLPGSFNVFETAGGTIVIDEPVPSWFLRTTLRAATGLGAGRQIRVAGPMLNVDLADLNEVGRLLGRGGGVLVLHGLWNIDRLDAIRQGAAANEVPPLVVQTADERTAIQQGLERLRPDDVMLVLAEDPSAVVKLIDRRLRRRPRSALRSPGAA